MRFPLSLCSRLNKLSDFSCSSSHRRTEPFPWLASNAMLDSSQGTVRPFSCHGTLNINQNPRSISSGLESCPVCLYTEECLFSHVLFNFMWLVIGQPCNLLRSLSKASSPSRESTTNLLNIHLSPVSRSFIKALKRTGLKKIKWRPGESN